MWVSFNKLNAGPADYIGRWVEFFFNMINIIQTVANNKRIVALASLSTMSCNDNLDSLKWYISGLIDAEGSFGVSLVKKSSSKTGYGVLVYFEIALNSKDNEGNNLRLLPSSIRGGRAGFTGCAVPKVMQGHHIKNVWGLSNILYYNNGDDTYKLKVSNYMDLCSIVVQHFNKYPLFTQKRVDFLLMCKILQIIENKRHHTLEGLREIVQFKTSINLATLSEKLAKDFPDVKNLPR